MTPSWADWICFFILPNLVNCFPHLSQEYLIFVNMFIQTHLFCKKFVALRTRQTLISWQIFCTGRGGLPDNIWFLMAIICPQHINLSGFVIETLAIENVFINNKAVKTDVGVDHNDVAQVENSAGVETCSCCTNTLSHPYSPGSPGHWDKPPSIKQSSASPSRASQLKLVRLIL